MCLLPQQTMNFVVFLELLIYVYTCNRHIQVWTEGWHLTQTQIRCCRAEKLIVFLICKSITMTMLDVHNLRKIENCTMIFTSQYVLRFQSYFLKVSEILALIFFPAVAIKLHGIVELKIEISPIVLVF